MKRIKIYPSDIFLWGVVIVLFFVVGINENVYTRKVEALRTENDSLRNEIVILNAEKDAILEIMYSKEEEEYD